MSACVCVRVCMPQPMSACVCVQVCMPQPISGQKRADLGNESLHDVGPRECTKVVRLDNKHPPQSSLTESSHWPCIFLFISKFPQSNSQNLTTYVERMPKKYLNWALTFCSGEGLLLHLNLAWAYMQKSLLLTSFLSFFLLRSQIQKTQSVLEMTVCGQMNAFPSPLPVTPAPRNKTGLYSPPHLVSLLP